MARLCPPGAVFGILFPSEYSHELINKFVPVGGKYIRDVYHKFNAFFWRNFGYLIPFHFSLNEDVLEREMR